MVILQDELVEVVQEQLSCIEDNAEQLALLTSRVNELTVDVASKTAEISNLTLEKQSIEERFAAVSQEKDALIEQLRSGGAAAVGGSSGGEDRDRELAALKLELANVRASNAQLCEELRQEQMEKLTAWDDLEALQAPEAIGGSFKRVLAVVEAAASVTKKKQGAWDRAGCEKLVEDMVKSMLSKVQAEDVAAVRGYTTKVGAVWLFVCGWFWLNVLLVWSADNAPALAPLRGACGASEHV